MTKIKISSVFSINIFFLALLFFTSFPAHAITGIVPDSQIINVNCTLTSNNCFGTLSINDTIYGMQVPVCDIPNPSGGCSSSRSPEGYAIDQPTLFNAYLSGLNSLSDNLNTHYYGPYENCSVLSNGIQKCQVVEMVKQTDGSWAKSYLGFVQPIIQYTVAPCPNSGSYIYGMGCTTTAGSNPTQRVVSALPNNCLDCFISQLNQGVYPSVGNPISVNNAAKVETKTDITYPINFTRTYSSSRSVAGTLGLGWKHNYDKKLIITPVNISGVNQGSYIGTLNFTEENDTEMIFTRPNASSSFAPAFKDIGGFKVTLSGTNYVLSTPNGNIETYDNTGNLISLSDRNGYTLTFNYVTSGTANVLNQVTDSYNHTLNFIYTSGILSRVVTDNLDTMDYGYTSGQLTSAAYNTSEVTQYAYTNNLLTSVTDENNNLYSVFTYDTQNRALETKQLSSPTTYVHQFDMDYTNAASNIYKTTRGNTSTMTYTMSRVNSQNNVASGAFTSASTTLTYGFLYDTNGYPSRYADSKSNYTYFTYDSNGLLQSLKRPDNNITSYVWDSNTRLLQSTTQTTTNGTRTISYQYDTNQNVTQKSILSTTSTGSETRTWNFTYTTFGKILTMTEPNGNVTTYTYYSDTDSVASRRGQINTVTNGLNQVITISSYDSRGNPTTLVSPNGVTKTLTYDARGRVLTETIGSATNTYTYDLVGNLLTSSFANGLALTFTYDQAHRLTALSDNNGNSLTYTLDPDNDEPTNTSIYQNSTLNLVKNQVFDKLDRMNKDYHSNVNQANSYVYDNNNNVTTDTNTNSNANTLSYNSLDQLTASSGRDGTQAFTYDIDGNIKTASLNSVTTTSSFNDFGELTQLISPETGTTNTAYSVANRTVTSTDALGITHTMTYDKLGRLLSDNHVKGTNTQTETFTYDTATHGVGKLASASNTGTSINYQYDALSELIQKTQVVGTVSKTVSYGYDNAGQITSMTYPSGLVVHYTYTNGLVTGMNLSGTVSANLIGSALYRPFDSGFPQSYVWNTSKNSVRQYNTDDKLTNLTTDGAINQGFTIDGEGNVTAVADSLDTTKSITTVYDTNNKLKTFTQNTKAIGLNYDNNYNRSSSTNTIVGSQNITYTYTGNRITSYSVNNSGTVTNNAITYDSNGNQLTDGATNYSYDLTNNLNSYTKSAVTTTYGFNALGERVLKSGSTNTYFVYDEQANLIGEYDNSGNAIIEHIYLNGVPIAAVQGTNIYNVHTDQIGTPRVITNSTNTIVWKWDNTDPFGKNLPSVSTLNYNIRFAGQYFDNESNLHYNYYRTYNPLLGRYIQPDPMGLQAGFNLYNYVAGNPMNSYDKRGLDFAGFSLQEPNTGWGTKAYFQSENANKKEFALQDDSVEYLLGHSGPNNFGGYSGIQISVQLTQGKLLTGGKGTPTDYIKRMITTNQPINIVLDGCNAATPNWNKDSQSGKMVLSDNVAQSLGKELRSYLNKQGLQKLPINIYAASGFAYWTGFSNPILDYITPSFISTSQGPSESKGQWEHLQF